MSSLENEKDVVYGDKSNYVANQTDAIDNTEYKDTVSDFWTCLDEWSETDESVSSFKT